MDDLFRQVVNAVNESQGTAHCLRSVEACAGGDINQAAILECSDGVRLFVKFHHRPPEGMFAAEAAGLRELADSGAVRVPAPLATDEFRGTGFLALECLHMARRDRPEAAAELGRALARLHQLPQQYFGWHRDNTIGSTPQINSRCDDWLTFFAEHRLGFQVHRLMDRGAPTELGHLAEQLTARLPELFTDATPSPSLLHGDLWGGNWSGLAGGGAVMFDPACYYGDRETDLAMTELFGGFGPAFYEAYQAVWPLPAGYRRRKPLYQLYHVLNHANLFGGGYLQQSMGLMNRLLESHQ
jgi:fructosamine-3-kinase